MSDREQTVQDVDVIRDALIVLSAYLPHFTDDRRKRERAGRHFALRQSAFDALDRIADRQNVPRPKRVVPDLSL